MNHWFALFSVNLLRISAFFLCAGAGLIGCSSVSIVTQEAQCGLSINYVSGKIGAVTPFDVDDSGTEIRIAQVAVSDDVRKKTTALLTDIDQHQYDACRYIAQRTSQPVKDTAWLGARNELESVAGKLKLARNTDEYCKAFGKLNCLAEEMGIRPAKSQANDIVCP